MKLGFFYHINVFILNGRIYLPQYLGLFVDELAKNTEHLYYFAFSTLEKNPEQSYSLEQNNIKLIDLGRKPAFPYLVLFGGKILSQHKHIASICDRFLVRAPSPLAPHFYFKYRHETKISYLMVGDYLEGIKHQNNHFIKQKLINIFTLFNEIQQNMAVKKSQCLVNSIPLRVKYNKLNPDVRVIKTTTLTTSDFFERKDTCEDPKKIRLLFVGRIEKAKGMDELGNAFIGLQKLGYFIELHLAGWESEEAMSYFNEILNKCKVPGTVVFHGFKSGIELNKLYRRSDIFVLPTHHEGFPRVIWEAMANSLPVVSTNVGSIPMYLTDGFHAMLIEPKNAAQLGESIRLIVENKELRQKLIKNGYGLVMENTLDKHVTKLIELILLNEK